MRKKLFEVEDVLYTVSGRLILASRVKKDSLDFNYGDSIVLVLSDGNEIKTIISSGGNFKVQKTLVQTVIVDDLKKKMFQLELRFFWKHKKKAVMKNHHGFFNL